MDGTMSERDLRLVHPEPERKPAVPNAVLGTIIFILTEIMFFGAFISAYSIAKTGVPSWPPLDQPRLPIEETLINSVALLVSGGLIWWAGRRFGEDPITAKVPFALSLALGAFFVLFQGAEWYALLSEGLGLTTSTHASFFYVIVGMHALHAIAGLAVMVVLFTRLLKDTLSEEAFWAGRVWWYFVVLLWPILYYRVYLG